MEDIVEAARTRLNALKSQEPPRRRTTKRAQIKALENEIRELISAGWGANEIAKALSESGLEITAGALKNQLYKIRKSESQTAKSGREIAKAVSPAARPQTPARRPAAPPTPEAEPDEEPEDAQ